MLHQRTNIQEPYVGKAPYSFDAFCRNTLDRGARVVVRLDLNLPHHTGRILDKTRLDVAIQCLRVMSHHRLTLLTHWGNPKGYEEAASVGFLAPLLETALQRRVTFAPTMQDVNAIHTVALLENVRFLPGETTNDPQLSYQLSQLGDVFVNEAFSASHREHASIVGIAAHIPSYMGPHFEQEWRAADRLIHQLHKDYTTVALIGGRKVSTKIDLLYGLLPLCDHVMIGGGMGNTFLAMLGVPMAQSFVEEKSMEVARQCWEKWSERIILPIDGVECESHIVTTKPQQAWGDIGPATVQRWKEYLARAQTLFWNGPMGIYEEAPLNQGNLDIAHFLNQHNRSGHVYSVAGGADTLSAIGSAYFSYKSPSGGAFMEALVKGTLPGIIALQNQCTNIVTPTHTYDR